MEELITLLTDSGATHAAVVKTADIVFDRGFRRLCRANSCGQFGKNYMCPPDVGDIDELIAHAKSFDFALVYQTIGALEDSYDFEGMMAAGEAHGKLTMLLQQRINNGVLHLGAGGCRLCSVCGKADGVPCRNPEFATGSLEAYGIDVTALARLAGMRYVNGENTVTYFGVMFYNE